MMKKILFALVGLVLLSAIPVSAFANTMVINNIEMTNFMPARTLDAQDEIYPVQAAREFAVEFAPDISLFQITILQSPYEENRQKAEQVFVEKLQVTKNEACFLNVRVVAPAFVQQEAPDDETLSFCPIEKRVDTNGDATVNTFDYAICLDEMNNPPDDFKMACDFNVNRRIDATDLSQVITYLEKL